MKQPAQYELKKWLCEHSIKGLIVHYYQTGTDTSDTDWELIPTNGKPKRLKASTVSGLVEIRPDWVRVLAPLETVKREVEDYAKFEKANSAELAIYKQLKEKFEGGDK